MEEQATKSWTLMDFIPDATEIDTSHYTTLKLDNSSYISMTHDINVTLSSSPPWAEDIKPYLEIMLLALVIIMMLSMGCEVHWEHIVSHLKRPISLCIGMLTQFIVLPLFTFLVLIVCTVKNVHAAGVLIVSCCPGGVLSNSFTYLCDGDLSLSIAMTTVSTIVAMGMLPVNTWLYGRQFESNDLVIPYVKMALSMIVVTSPALVGMAIKYKFPNVASRMAKIGVMIGLVLILIYTTSQVVILYHKFASIAPKLHALILLLPITGFCLGYGLSTVTKQTPAVRKTIAIETGVQNLPLAVTIISLSFPPKLGEEIMVIPFLYAFTMVGGATLFCIGYSLCKKYSRSIKYEETPQIPHTCDVENGLKKNSIHEQSIYVCESNGKHNGFIKFTPSKEIPDSPSNRQEIDSESFLKQQI